MEKIDNRVSDVFVIGGGVNGCAIARDAVGRGLSVTLAEMGDLGSATSSSSTKLFHGGLRYLEYFEFRLVKEALEEREILLQNMPHISWPMRFVLPISKAMRFDNQTPTSRLLTRIMPWMRGRRPDWLIRTGLFLYDHLGGRKILPGTKTLDLRTDVSGAVLHDGFTKAYEYSDCWVDDARLVSLLARDAEQRGARIMTHNQVTSARPIDGLWHIETKSAEDGQIQHHRAKMIVNAAGPWVAQVLNGSLGRNSNQSVRLVRGSHIVTRKLFDHGKCYFFQGGDGRITFAIPYETDFTLIGTTDVDHDNPNHLPTCTDAERDYLISFVNTYFKRPVTTDDIVWSYSGVRPLYDQGTENASAATRDYVLTVDDSANLPILNVFGGKITTHRRLAESAMDKIAPYFPNLGRGWTRNAPLPGGDFAVDRVPELIADLTDKFRFLSNAWATRLMQTYGLDAWTILGAASAPSDLGHHFGDTLYEAEVRWLMAHELARTGQDILWRRTKLGLKLSTEQADALDQWVHGAAALGEISAPA